MNCTGYGIVLHLTWVLLLLFRSIGFAAQPMITARVSVNSSGNEGNNYSYHPSISADRRYVAFDSSASNLVISDTNETNDIFIHNRLTMQTTRVSVNSDGIEGNNFSNNHAISANGQYVAFTSLATNLVDNDTNGREDVFVHNRQDGTTSRVSVHSNGTEGDSGSSNPSISADGQYVAFDSGASNLVASDTNGAMSDIFFPRPPDRGNHLSQRRFQRFARGLGKL
jgi:Tol biopolymer transport system component